VSGWIRFLSRGDAADKARRRGRRGQALITVVVALPLLIGATAMGVTLSTVYFARANLQNAVDAAALAGAAEMGTVDASAPGDQAFLITRNDPAAQNGCVEAAPNTCGLNVLSIPNTVVATATEKVSGGFANLFGIHQFTIRAIGVASYGPGEAFDYAIFQGDPNVGGSDNPELGLNGNVSINSANGMSGANIHSNNGMQLVGNVTVDGACTASNAGVTLTGNVTCNEGTDNGVPVIPMPQWNVKSVTATPPATTTIGSPSNPVGYTFSGNTSLTGNWVVYGNVDISGNVTGPGTLVVYGNVTVTGNFSGPAVLIAHGTVNMAGNISGNAQIYAFGAVTVSGNSGTGAITAIGGSITLSGNVSGPGGNGVGVALAALPPPGDPTQAENITLNGNVSGFSGVLYAPAGTIVMNGNPSIDGAVVGWLVDMNGNVSVTYDAGQLKAIPFNQVALVQ
jgi:cytoskeletal protein CcmA (bactofilin family)